MGRLLYDREENLRAVPVGVLVFLVIIGVITAAVQVKNRAENVVVKITHVFKADKPEVKMKKKKVEQKIEKATATKTLNNKKSGEKKRVRKAHAAKAAKVDVKNESTKSASVKPVEKEKSSMKKSAQAKPAAEKPVAKTQAIEKIAAKKPAQGKQSEKVVQEKKVPKKKTARISVIADVPMWQTGTKRMATLKITDKEYSKCYRERFNEGTKKPAEFYSWRVSNIMGKMLKNCYELFDMKAVAVVDGKKFYDLGDGTQLTEDYLESRYSSTVIVCEDPASDFGEKADSFGIPSNDFSVRYYMFHNTRNYFYGRVEEAVSCLISQGRLNEDDKLKENIEVVGTVFNMEKKNGAFGVFVPSAVFFHDPASGTDSEIKVPASCLDNYGDVKLLKAANMM